LEWRLAVWTIPVTVEPRALLLIELGR